MKLLVRHGLSEANNYENYGTPAFGNPESSLMPKGREQATKLGGLLVTRYTIDVATEPVAVSMMRRAQETAIVAGFRYLHICPELDEEKGGVPDEQVKEMLLNRQSPEATRTAARNLIENPPEEKVWVLHAWLIATICDELDINFERFTPKFCEVRELPI